MALIGGVLGYRVLRRISPSGETGWMDGSAYAGKSKLEMLLGPRVWRETAGKTVIDFGCGEGAEVIEMARGGARKVIGLDIRTDVLARARANAAAQGVADRCEFVSEAGEAADVITAIDSFEHFADPERVLERMCDLLRPDGCVLAAFGPTWYHPLGGHLFSVFPWAHLVFTEKALMRWRAGFKNDGATTFADVAGGLNRMTVRRFEAMVGRSGLRFAQFEAVPIRRLKPVANRLTREFTTAIVRCKLVAR
jgi:SAM-dependent methyltransferase